jgi:hypothetical protein
MTHAAWPSLRFGAWKDTCETLHMWTQVVGKVRLALEPHTNHWWQVPLYVSARGLTTRAMPIRDQARRIELEFDFFEHALVGRTSDGRVEKLPFNGMSVQRFYVEVMALLGRFDVSVRIWPVPVEVTNAIPFQEDTRAAYDAEYVRRFWHVLIRTDEALRRFRTSFTGKVSPVHFFWGSFDLAVTRFSGRTAPPHPGGIPNLADWVVRDAYSHEVSSCGFWPGGPNFDATFYAYAYPEPDGFSTFALDVQGASYDSTLREFVLPYEAVRAAAQPETLLDSFLQRTYEAAAVQGKWDRAALERQPGA